MSRGTKNSRKRSGYGKNNGGEEEEQLPIVDLTRGSQPFVICKIPNDVYQKVLKLVETKPTPVKKKQNYRIKGTWTKEEDERLLKMVEKYGAKKWPSIAEHMKGRNGKQCRERYLNHLDPNINHGEWSQEEDDLITELHGEFGNAWAKMSRKLPGRPANMIKNRWNSTLWKIVAKKRGLKIDKSSHPRNRGRKKKEKKEKKKAPKKKRGNNHGRTSPPMNIPHLTELGPPQSPRLPNVNPLSPMSKSTYLYQMELDGDFEMPDELQKKRKSGSGIVRSRNESGIPDEYAPPKKKFKYLDTPPSSRTFSLISELGDTPRSNFYDDIADYDIENPFPSPRHLESSNTSRTDFYQELSRRNARINLGLKPYDSYDSSIDEKLGISSSEDDKNGINFTSILSPGPSPFGTSIKVDDLERYGIINEKTDNVKKMVIKDRESSAKFASDYGIELTCPSELSVEVWPVKDDEFNLSSPLQTPVLRMKTPRREELEERKKKAILKIDVFPVPNEADKKEKEIEKIQEKKKK